MKPYSIFVHRNKINGSLENILLVEECFNYKAALFHVFWFLLHGLWYISLGILLLLSLTFYLPNFWRFLVQTLLLLLAGFEANDLRCHHLDRTGNYFFSGFAMGMDESDAKLRFLEKINQEDETKNKIIY
jgi:hypothetical protein